MTQIHKRNVAYKMQRYTSTYITSSPVRNVYLSLHTYTEKGSKLPQDRAPTLRKR